ncbi:MAG: peptidoglycan bridge formation glycyltransferase FemA/FemB family protein [Candidatus Sungbacteria bacterium]|uniref:Peptidoglycan bridge formation glycyltransferase FemA/FemB family protein n=1 Tax=Candidatus Sungiibacteriota bacterium TaxID=2750080 RepID=A0A9D6QYV9_9BACT|nr:peptidoglycan bridge formation glycyltransferase FemA/FemB family protein [Candidatus Sungbacteria bacterium]
MAVKTESRIKSQELRTKELPIAFSSQPSFLQSEEWAAIQERDKRPSALLRFGDEEVRFFLHELPGGFHYAYAPHPVINNRKAFLESLNMKTIFPNAIFYRIEAEAIDQTFEVPNTSVSLQPQETIILDLSKNDGELLSLMHPKTRYNLRVALRHAIRTENLTSETGISILYGLLKETARRDRFHLHEKRHYQNLISANSEAFSNEIFVAFKANEPAAAAIVNFHKGRAVYLHGGSRYELRAFMAPYPLHWRIITEAQQRGCATYNLWGIDEKKWPGVTRFKKGFGGKIIQYPRAFDVVRRPFWYLMYQSIRSFV